MRITLNFPNMTQRASVRYTGFWGQLRLTWELYKITIGILKGYKSGRNFRTDRWAVIWTITEPRK